MAWKFSVKKEPVVKNPVMEYSQIEQGTAAPAETVTPAAVTTGCPDCGKAVGLLEKVIEQQAVLSDNQQTILNAIGGTQELIKSLVAVPVEEEVEVTEEEAEAAIAELKKKKARGKKK
jgi:hypothetical protein